jgi:hypothetical protein
MALQLAPEAGHAGRIIRIPAIIFRGWPN